MMRSVAFGQRTFLGTGHRSLATAPTVYSPTTTEARPGEMGTGGRSSVAGLKVAVFGASGFLGNYMCGELGTFSLHQPKKKQTNKENWQQFI